MKQQIIEVLKLAKKAIDLNDEFNGDMDARHATEIDAVYKINEVVSQLESEKSIKAGDADDYDSMNVMVSSLKHARKARYEDLLDQGFTEEEARVESHKNIEVEFFYEKGCGLFAVESEAVETNTLISPYSGSDIIADDKF